MEVFNTRELASATWLLLFLVFVCCKIKPWKELKDLVHIALKPKLLTPFILLTVYTVICVLYLYNWNLWTLAQLKSTLYWYFLGGAWIVFKVATDSESPSPILIYVKGILGISIFVEFIVGFKTMNYLAELVVVGLALMFTAIEVYSNGKVEFSAVNKISKSVLSVLGFIVISVGLHGIYRDFSNLNTAVILRDNLYFLFIGFAYVPAIYLLTLYCLYDLVYVRLKIYFKDSKLKLYYAFILVLNFCHFMPSRIRINLKGNINQLYDSIEYSKMYTTLKPNT